MRSPRGAWYIDPYYHLDDSVYVSYYGRDLVDDPHGTFVERDLEGRRTRSTSAHVAVRGRARGDAAHLPARAGHRPDVRDLLRRPANVTAAKVTLMNRVDQIYEDETAIRLVLIADTDKLNLDTAARHDRRERPVRRGGVLHGARRRSLRQRRR